jgi:hypothetical protein
VAKPVPKYADVPMAVLDRMRSICTALPDASEERAWTGIRWVVRKRTFAHVLALAAGSESAHHRASGTSGDVVIVTFRAAGDELDALRNAGHPFFSAGWGRDVIGMVIDDDVDWSEVRELMVDRPTVADDQV